MFSLLLFLFLPFQASAASASELSSCCVLGEQCFSICFTAFGGVDPSCFANCHAYYCPVCDPLPSMSDSGEVPDFAAVVASVGALSYVVISACFLFSFLGGLSFGRK